MISDVTANDSARDGALHQAAERPRRYSKPRLSKLGDVRALTFGGSAGALDSGAADIQQPPGGPIGGGS
jgi:hypothetical protein